MWRCLTLADVLRGGADLDSNYWHEEEKHNSFDCCRGGVSLLISEGCKRRRDCYIRRVITCHTFHYVCATALISQRDR